MSGLYPDIASLELTTVSTEAVTDLGKHIKFNFASGEFDLQDGKVQKVDGDEALRIWIEKILRTEKFRFKVYDRGGSADEYGITLQDLIVGYNYPLEFYQSELTREISDALTKHPNISALAGWNIIKDPPNLTVSFQVIKADGTTIEAGVSL